MGPLRSVRRVLIQGHAYRSFSGFRVNRDFLVALVMTPTSWKEGAYDHPEAIQHRAAHTV
jgi:hypothetical protein